VVFLRLLSLNTLLLRVAVVAVMVLAAAAVVVDLGLLLVYL
jgi:hypothetical protein